MPCWRFQELYKIREPFTIYHLYYITCIANLLQFLWFFNFIFSHMTYYIWHSVFLTSHNLFGFFLLSSWMFITGICMHWIVLYVRICIVLFVVASCCYELCFSVLNKETTYSLIIVLRLCTGMIVFWSPQQNCKDDMKILSMTFFSNWSRILDIFPSHIMLVWMWQVWFLCRGTHLG